MSDKSPIELIEKLYPVCRSITGDGVRQSLRILQDYVPLEIVEVPTGATVFDWEIPREWNIKDAYIKDSSDTRVVDFLECNLHVLNYSMPLKRRMTLDELRPHLHSLPEQPDVIPYRTSYYNEDWGFCVTHKQLESLPDDEYEVVIDSTLEAGSLTYGEFSIKGQHPEEVLVSTHVCHPSLCNDNLSGIATCTFLARYLEQRETRYSYRFLFIPVTIGAIAWLARSEDKLGSIRHGLVASNLADDGGFTYKKSRSGNAEIDVVVEHVLQSAGVRFEIRDFSPYGYDERQFNSPGIGLCVGSLSRTPFGEYPQYHTSADNLDFISHDNLRESISVYKEIVDVLEGSRFFVNSLPKGEPQLGKRGLYKKIGGETDQEQSQMAMLWLLNLCDGSRSLLHVAKRSGIDIGTIIATAERLADSGLLTEVPVASA